MTSLDTEFHDSVARAMGLEAQIDSMKADLVRNERQLAAMGDSTWQITADSCNHCHGRRLRYVLDHALRRWEIEPRGECFG